MNICPLSESNGVTLFLQNESANDRAHFRRNERNQKSCSSEPLKIALIDTKRPISREMVDRSEAEEGDHRERTDIFTAGSEQGERVKETVSTGRGPSYHPIGLTRWKSLRIPYASRLVPRPLGVYITMKFNSRDRRTRVNQYARTEELDGSAAETSAGEKPWWKS